MPNCYLLQGTWGSRWLGGKVKRVTRLRGKNQAHFKRRSTQLFVAAQWRYDHGRIGSERRNGQPDRLKA